MNTPPNGRICMGEGGGPLAPSVAFLLTSNTSKRCGLGARVEVGNEALQSQPQSQNAGTPCNLTAHVRLGSGRSGFQQLEGIGP